MMALCTRVGVNSISIYSDSKSNSNRFLFLFSLISWYPIVSSLQHPYGLGRGEGREPCVPHVVPFLLAHPDMTLQHDNATSHTARSVRDFLQDRNVSVLPWPAKSPDFNPIEHVWDLLDRRGGLGPFPSEMSGNLHVPLWMSGVTSHRKNWQIWCSP